MIKKIKFTPSLEVVLFGFLALLLCIFTFFVPPFQKPDEPVHFFRTITLFNGQLSCKTEGEKRSFTLPISVYNFPNSMFVREIPMSSNKFPITLFKQKFPWIRDTQTIDDFAQCILPFYAYIPEIIATALSYPFDNLLVTFFAMRMMNAIVFFFCVFIVQKIVAKWYKGIFWLFAFTPMVLHQVSAVSYDAASMTFGMLMLAFFLSLLSKAVLSYKEAISFGVLLVLFNIVKAGYYPTYLLFIPIAMKVKIKWDWRKTVGGFFLLLIGVLAVVKEFSSLHFQYFFSYSDMPQALQFALTHPLYFMNILTKTLEEDANALLHETVGQLGWIDYAVSPYIFTIYFIILGLVIAHYLRTNANKISTRLLVLFWIIIILTVYLIFFHFYISVTPAAYYKVVSMQGRYFLPIFPLIIVTIDQTILFLRKTDVGKVLSLCLLFILFSFFIIRSIYLRYYDYSKQIINYNPLIEKIHSSQLDIKTLTSIAIDTEKTFIIPTDISIGSKISGFQFVPSNEFDVIIPYEFFVKDATCTMILAHGYLDRLRGIFLKHIRFPDDPVYTQYFSITRVSQNSVCITLGPAMKTLGGNEPLKIYRDANDVPIIRLLYLIQ